MSAIKTETKAAFRVECCCCDETVDDPVRALLRGWTRTEELGPDDLATGVFVEGATHVGLCGQCSDGTVAASN